MGLFLLLCVPLIVSAISMDWFNAARQGDVEVLEKMIGKVEVPQEALLAVLQVEND